MKGMRKGDIGGMKEDEEGIRGDERRYEEGMEGV